MLKTKDFVDTQKVEYKRLLKANMIFIDDVMLYPLEKSLAIAFFNFIKHIYESTSIVIKTNKIPTEWAKMVDDEMVVTALLDRLKFRCEVVNLTGESHGVKTAKPYLNPKI